MVLSIAAFCIRIYLRSLPFQKNLYFFLFEGGWSFCIASIEKFKGLIVFLSIICPRNFSRVRKKCDLSGAAFMFSISIFDRGIVSSGSARLKIWFIVYFESLFGGPDKFILSMRLFFLLKGIDLF